MGKPVSEYGIRYLFERYKKGARYEKKKEKQSERYEKENPGELTLIDIKKSCNVEGKTPDKKRNIYINLETTGCILVSMG